MDCNRTEGYQMQGLKGADREDNDTYVDFLSKGKPFVTQPFYSHQDSSTCSSTVLQSSPNTPVKADKPSQLNSPYECTISGQIIRGSGSSSGSSTLTLEPKVGSMAADSSSENSSQWPEEMIYLDDIEEFKSPTAIDTNCEDQRLFKFKQSVFPKKDEFRCGLDEGYVEQYDLLNENVSSEISRKSGKAGGKRLKRRSVTIESSSIKDVEYATYYGESCNNSSNHHPKSHHQRKHQKKIPKDESQSLYCAQEVAEHPYSIRSHNNFKSCEYRYNQMKSCCRSIFSGEMVTDCSLEHPCYSSISDGKDDWECPPWKQRRRSTNLEVFPAPNLKEEKVQHGICHGHCSCNGEQSNQNLLPQRPRGSIQNSAALSNNLIYSGHLPNKQSKKVEGEAEGSKCLGRPEASLSSNSNVNRSYTIKGTQPPYLRAMTMPTEWPKDSRTNYIARSNSFPFRQPHLLSSMSPSSRHVHPKLPDYDELAARFRALKKENLQKLKL